MEVRPIDANALMKRRRNFGKPYALDPIDRNIDDQIIDLIDVLKAPTLDYAPVKRGEWGKAEIVGYDGIHAVYAVPCSACGKYTSEYLPPYCPNCGARMDGGT